MLLHVWGTDFRRSPSEFRSRLFVPESERAASVRRWLSLGFRDLVYVATCNRVEFYTTARDVYCDTRALWLSLLNDLGLPAEAFYSGYCLEGKSALRHLLRVASSLESLVIGEPQILGQLKDAVSWSKTSGFPLERSLEKTFSLAFETAKKIRSTSGIGEHPISVATLGMRHFEAHEPACPVRQVAVVGRSPICVHVVQWFSKNRPEVPVVWINRDPEKLQPIPESSGTRVRSLASFIESPDDFSHLFTATSSRSPIFGKGFFARLSTEKRVFFDFAQPPDIEHSAISADQYTLVHMENLMEEARSNAEARQRSVERAERLIESAMREFFLSQKEAPVLRDFSAIERDLEMQVTEALSGYVSPPEGSEAARVWIEKLLKRNLHQAREHLRKILRVAAAADVVEG